MEEGLSLAEKQDILALFQTGRLPEIESRAQSLTRRFPAEVFGWSVLGAVWLHLGRSDLALSPLEQAIALSPGEAGLHTNRGLALANLGHQEAALASFARALQCDPHSVPAYNHQGNALVALNRLEEAAASYQRSLDLSPGQPRTLYNLGNASLGLGRLDEAVACYRQALTLRPDYAYALTNLGTALKELGELTEAASCATQALLLAPELVEALDLSASLALLIDMDVTGAMSLVCRSLDIEERPETKRLFVACAKGLPVARVDAALQGRLLRALIEPWARPTDVAGICSRVIEADGVVGPCIGRAMDSWPRRLDADSLFGPYGFGALVGDALLLGLLDAAPICSVPLERFLTMVRRLMLKAATAERSVEAVSDERTLAFYAALARQCRVNEYVFDCTEAEWAEVRTLRGRLEAALRVGGEIPPLWPVAVAAYEPLHTVPCIERLLERSWPDSVEAVLTQQLREHEEERLYRPTLDCLTAIEDVVSRQVRRQYEENPYPRWVRAAPAEPPVSLEVFLRRHVPLASLRPLPSGNGVDILIAGCGTGQHSLETARRFRGARVLAVDLSLTSLCYAKRKTRELGVATIEYAQADILRLTALERQFDLVESSGVLHHLADPLAGWRALLPLVRPGGILRLGFYSALARRGIARIRERLAAAGCEATPDAIRRFRQELMDTPWDPAGGRLLLSDFFSVSGCRDLFFHVQEHCLTLPDIQTFCLENGLTLLGFDIEPEVTAAYLRRFPDDPAATNLSHWHDFELERPDTFIEMYQFWVQKTS